MRGSVAPLGRVGSGSKGFPDSTAERRSASIVKALHAPDRIDHPRHRGLGLDAPGRDDERGEQHGTGRTEHAPHYTGDLAHPLTWLTRSPAHLAHPIYRLMTHFAIAAISSG